MVAGFMVCRRGDDVEIVLPAEYGSRGVTSLTSVARDDALGTGAVLLGRIDYRDELRGRLPYRDAREEVSDAALALAVYQHAGPAGLEGIEGEFSLVVWDTRRCRLFAMRDPGGAWPLYWHAREGSVSIGTSLRAFADGLRRPGLDLEYLGEFLTRPFLPAELPAEVTALPGTRRVAPGTLIEVDHAGRLVRRAGWDWTNRIAPIRETSADSVAERFRELLAGAVRERMRRGRVAAHLSGGMDSSSVALLAQRALAENAGGRPLATISLVYEAPELAPERSYIDRVLASDGAFEPHFIRADAALGFDWFDRPVPLHDEPYAGLWSLATNRLLSEVASQTSARTVLTGVGGDELLTYRPLHIADMLRRGRLIAGLRDAAAWAEGQGQGVWSVLWKCGLQPIWLSGLTGVAGALARRVVGTRAGAGRFSVPPWISPAFAREQRLAERFREHAHRLFTPTAELSETLSRMAMSSGDWARWYLHAPQGIDVSHPFLDPRVACYALGIPRSIRAVPGAPKPVLQAAMRGLLPDAIRNRRQKTGFNGPHSRGLARHLSNLEALVRGSGLRALGLYDADTLLTAIQNLALGIESDHNEWLDRTLALIAWFEQHEGRPTG